MNSEWMTPLCGVLLVIVASTSVHSPLWALKREEFVIEGENRLPAESAFKRVAPDTTPSPFDRLRGTVDKPYASRPQKDSSREVRKQFQGRHAPIGDASHEEGWFGATEMLLILLGVGVVVAAGA